MFRSRWCAGLLAVLAVAVPVVVTSTAATAAPTSQTQAARTVAVSESEKLPDTGASITVTGTGFDPAVDVYLAVCAADTAPSDSLTYCVGGEVPGDNTGPSWAVVTSEPSGKQNAKEFGADGKFSVDLTIEAAVGSSVDCVTNGCVLMVRSVGEQNSRPADITIGLGFQTPTSSSESTTTTTSTSDAPSTVGPDTVALPDAYAGQQQTVVFTGFTANEDVAVTVFSDPVTVPGIKASAGGVVAITFAVTDALVPGTHTVQAIGSQSGLIGLASFAVVNAPVTSASSSAESSASSSAVTSEASSAASSAPSTSETTSTTAATTSATDVVPVTPTTDSGRNLWWLWVTLILLIVVAGIAAAVVMSRRRAQQLEQERLDREQELAAAAAAEAAAAPVWPPTAGYQTPPRGYEPGDPGQSYGLLSGRQGDGPALYSGQGTYPTTRYEPPTQRIEPPTQRIEPPVTPPAPPAEPESSRTQAWSPFDEDEVDPAETELKPEDQ